MKVLLWTTRVFLTSAGPKSSISISWEPAGFFSRGRQIRGLGPDESPPARFRDRDKAPVRVWGEAQRSRRQVVKIMQKKSSTERLPSVTTNAQKTLQHFQWEGGKCPPCPCHRAPMFSINYVLLEVTIIDLSNLPIESNPCCLSHYLNNSSFKATGIFIAIVKL